MTNSFDSVLSVMEFWHLEEADRILHSKFSSRLLEQIFEHFKGFNFSFMKGVPYRRSVFKMWSDDSQIQFKQNMRVCMLMELSVKHTNCLSCFVTDRCNVG